MATDIWCALPIRKLSILLEYNKRRSPLHSIFIPLSLSLFLPLFLSVSLSLYIYIYSSGNIFSFEMIWNISAIL